MAMPQLAQKVAFTEKQNTVLNGFTAAHEKLTELAEAVRNNYSEHQRECRADMLLRLARVVNTSAVLNEAQASLVSEAVSRFAYRFAGSEEMSNEDYYYATIRESESLILIASFINSCKPN